MGPLQRLSDLPTAFVDPTPCLTAHLATVRLLAVAACAIALLAGRLLTFQIRGRFTERGVAHKCSAASWKPARGV